MFRESKLSPKRRIVRGSENATRRMVEQQVDHRYRPPPFTLDSGNRHRLHGLEDDLAVGSTNINTQHPIIYGNRNRYRDLQITKVGGFNACFFAAVRLSVGRSSARDPPGDLELRPSFGGNSGMGQGRVDKLELSDRPAATPGGRSSKSPRSASDRLSAGSPSTGFSRQIRFAGRPRELPQYVPPASHQSPVPGSDRERSPSGSWQTV